MLDLNLLRTFVAVAEERRISKAARLLRVPKSTISRHIAKLEEDLQLRIFDRTPDGFELTAQGQRLYQKVYSPVHDLSIDASRLARRERQGRVSIHSPAIYGEGILKPILLQYLAERPECNIDAHFSDRFAAPDLDLFDLGFYVGMSPGQDVDIWPLGTVEAKLYASPALFGERSAPAEPSDLKNWPIASPDCEPGRTGRLKFGAGGEKSALTGPVRLKNANPQVLLGAALAGVAITRLPTFYADDAVDEGLLVPVLPELATDRHTVSIARSKRNNNAMSIDFAEFVFERLA